MNKRVLCGVLLLATTGSIWAGGIIYPRSADAGGNDTIQPIDPVSDDPGSTMQPGPGVTVAVPEPSTLSLLAGAGMISSWFFLRRRR